MDRELIHRRLGKQLGISTVQLYLLKWGISRKNRCRVPLNARMRRSSTGLSGTIPKIARRANREKALIYWGDETGVSNQDQVGRSSAPRGQTPVIHKTAKKLTTSMISAVNNRGLMRFMCFKGALNAGLFITFLGRLIKDAPNRIFLIVDDLRVHKSAKVSQWVEAHKDEIELHFLPPYAPARNPDEYLNNDLKQQLKNLPRPDNHEDLSRPPRRCSVRYSVCRIGSGPTAITRTFITPLNVWYYVGVLVARNGTGSAVIK